MLFKTFGDNSKPTVLLLHGAGLSWWAYREVAALLSADYHVVLAVIDGYGEDAHEPFESIEKSAQKLLAYIRAQQGGHVFALGGLSLGAQIVAEALSQAPAVADFAVLESALVYPLRGIRPLIGPMVRMSMGLIRKRWFARWQAKAMKLPDTLFEEYYADSMRITRESLTNTLLSNSAYTLKPGLTQTSAGTLILVGEGEVGAERKSAEALHRAIAGSTLYVAPGLIHGELSLARPAEYAARLRAHFAGVAEAAGV